MEGTMMKTVELKITGMHCDSCAALIDDELADMEGVSARKVETGRAIVEFDEKKTGEAAIKRAITDLGYRVI